MWEWEWGKLYKTGSIVKEDLRARLSYRRSLAECQLLGEIKSGKFCGYVQCDIDAPNKLTIHFGNAPPIFKNTHVARKDNGMLMKQYSEEESLMSQPHKRLNSTIILQNGTLNTRLLLFYLELRLVCTKMFRFTVATL